MTNDKDAKLLRLVAEMYRVKGELDACKLLKAKLEKEHDRLRISAIPEEMDNRTINSITFDGIGRVTLTADVHASILAENRSEAYEWLEENGHGGIIKDTVNAGTLKATMKVCLKKGEKIPPCIKVTPFSRASITKV